MGNGLNGEWVVRGEARLHAENGAYYNVSMIRLDERQIEAAQQGNPVEVRDGDHILYLISKQQFDRLRPLLESEGIDPSFFEFDDSEDS
jgi:hypothetical protein